MNGEPIRAVTFQSIDRTSSPGWYSRTSSNERPVPLKTEWYSPPNRVCTARRARSWRRRICRITSAGRMSPRLRLLEGLDLRNHLHLQFAGDDFFGEVPGHLRLRQGQGPRRLEGDRDRREPDAVLGERPRVAGRDVTHRRDAPPDHDRVG